MMEHEISLEQDEFEDLASEPCLANGWVVASRYTAQTLAEHGVPVESIHVVPYGVDCGRFRKRLRPPPPKQKFKVVFIGSIIQRKGLSYLLEAIRMLGSKNIRILLCGRGLIDKRLLSQYSDLDLEVKFGLPVHRLVEEIHQSDLFALPSLSEGFAHVILEAMSCGLPVISTVNTCAPDVIEEGEHGFIVPIRMAEAIAEKLAWGLSHRADLAAMGEQAAMQAELFTWDRFRRGVREAYQKMLYAVDH